MSPILKRSVNSLRLGDLLVQAGLLTQGQMAEAVRNSRTKKVQIGQILVMNGLLSPRDLQSALEAQSMLRDKTVELNEALRCLKIAYKVGVSFKDILTEYTSPKKSQTSKLGELLVESGLITYEVLAKAVEQSYATGLPLGRMLVLQKTISNEVLTTALDLQVRVRDEMSSREEAIATLRAQAGLAPLAPEEVAEVQTKAPPAPHQEPPRKKGVRIGELMVMASVLTETDVMNALEWGLVNQQTIGQVLTTQKLVSQELLDSALELQKLVDNGTMEPLKASECLARVHAGASLEEAINDVKFEKDVSEETLSYEKLLMFARVVSEDEIEDAFDVSTKSASVLGKIMVLTGHMDVPTLQATLRCHQLLRSGLLSQDDAVVTLDYALHHITGVLKFDDALKQLGWSKERGLRLKGEPVITAQPAPKPGVEVTMVDGALASESSTGDNISAATQSPAAAATPETVAKVDAGSGTESDSGTGTGAGTDSGSANEINASPDINISIEIDASPGGGAEDSTKSGGAAEGGLAPGWERISGPINLNENASMSFHVRDDERLTSDAQIITSESLASLTDSDIAQHRQAAAGGADVDSLRAQIEAAESADATADPEGEASAKAKTKHSQTIQPEDARASRLAALMKSSVKSDNDLLVNFDPSADPPDALHRVFERLAHSYFTQQNYDKAQVLYERILVHRLNHFGPNDSVLVVDLTNLAGVLVAQEKFNQAEPFARRAVTILEQSNLAEPWRIADALSILGNIYLKQDKLKEAEPVYRRTLAIRRERLEPGHADIAQSLSDYARLLRRLKRDDEAEAMYQEAISMMSNLATSTGQFTALTIPHELTDDDAE